MAKVKKKQGPAEQSVRDAIVFAYIELISEIGAANVTLQKVAARADVAFGSVRYYFADSDEALHDAAIEVVLRTPFLMIEEEMFRARKKKDFDPVKTYVETMFLWISKYPSMGNFLIYFYYLSSTKMKLNNLNADLVDRAHSRIESYINEAVGKGVYQAPKDISLAAKAIHSSLIGAGFIGLSMKSKSEIHERKQLCLKLVDRILAP